MNNKVLVVQYRLLHYRVELFQKLRSMCQARGIEFCLVHGQPTASELKKRDVGVIDWADAVTNRYINIRGRDILWQSFPAKHRDADLVVMMQENRLLSNYPWLFWGNGTKAKTGYWGHGRNFQTDAPNGWREKWKKMLVGRVDWWFAYTQMTRDILVQDAYPDDRITVLDNAIDNQAFVNDLNAVGDDQLAVLRAELDLAPSARVGLFCGSLYPDKRIGFMVKAADRIRAAMPDFHWVVIGDGPSAQEIKDAALSRPWLHWVGVQKGAEKAAYFRLAHVVLNPGLVGLHILDSFCAGVPMVTTTDARHSPEVVYLENGVNGLMVAGDAAAYGDAIVELLNDTPRYAALRQGALAGAERYTLDNMVNNFVDGIERCLAAPKKTR